MTNSRASEISAHYGRSDLGEAILTWLQAQGKDINALTVEDLSPVDQYHGGRLASTRGLAQLAQVSAATRVADLGGGIGGPARFLAASFGCRVDVVDLTPAFRQVGQMLTDRLGLGDKVRFHTASATASGLGDAAYDLVWMQNAAMNIADRPALYGEIRRLLRPEGQYVFQEVLAGDGGPAYYPTNWASSAAESFLQSPEAVLRLLLDAGFRVLFWEDETEASRETRRQEQQERAASVGGTPPPSYLPPEGLREAALNNLRSSDEDRLRYGRGLFQRL
jgi:ubiquinone/menaquinone biosynthesis C-methylase UbiE